MPDTENEKQRVIESISGIVKAQLPGPADAAIVLGSGMGVFAEELETIESIPTSLIPGYPASTVHGHDGAILLCRHGSLRVLVFKGRIHGYEGYSALETALPAFIANALNARIMIVTNAAGGIDTTFQPGDLMLITDYLVLPLATRMGGILATAGQDRQRPDARSILDEETRRIVLSAAAEARVPLREGVYGFCSGPSYETRAEIAFLRKTGIHAIGMSSVPELIHAQKAGMRTIGLSCITNQTRTIRAVVSHDDVTRVAAGASARTSRLLKSILEFVS
jgi:purine-nucleoside phosphorylase